MSYKLCRDDGSETQGESPEEAAALMRGLEDAESGKAAPLRRVRGELARMFREAIAGGPDNEMRRRFYEGKKLIRLPNFWPRADPDEVAKTVKDMKDRLPE